MKKYATISLFIFWAVTVAVIAAGLMLYNGGNRAAGLNSAGGDPTSKITGISSAATTLVLSMLEIAKHNSSQSCWLLISGKVYDVTSFLNQHPGGAGEILSSCGTDATVAFDTKDGRGRPHSAAALAMLADYFIGNLNQAVTTNPANPNNPPVVNPNPNPIPPSSGENEFDD